MFWIKLYWAEISEHAIYQKEEQILECGFTFHFDQKAENITFSSKTMSGWDSER